jgi:ABC-type nitrate/sulfonate/bicarbonate transport system substrate-binding protein
MNFHREPFRSLFRVTKKKGADMTAQSHIRRDLSLSGALIALLASAVAAPAFAADPTIPQVEVRVSMMPYFDHSQASIALGKGWFDEVGIKFLPDGKGTLLTSADQAMGIAAAGSQDVMSGLPQLFMPGYKTLPKLQMFSVGDYFKGFAIMAQPDGGYKSYAEFRAEGASPEEAFQKTVGQMKGKKFAYPAEAAIKGFIDLALKRGGIALGDMTTVVAPDADTARLMESDNADFQVGGVPSRLTLQVAGYKPILTSGDLAAAATPSADSEELRAVLYGGWMATDKWIAENHDTALRMYAVSLRVNQLIKDHPDEALAIHVPYLNSAAGTNFDIATGKIVYSDLDPFLTFDEQAAIFDDPKNPLSIEYVTGAAIKLYESQGLFTPGEYKWTDFVVAGDLYHELVKLKAETDEALKKVDAASADKQAEAQPLVDKAKAFYAGFDFLDSAAFAKAAAEKIGG